MLHRLCVQADFDFHLGGLRLGTSAPRRLHPDHEDGIHRRVVVGNFRIKLGHNRSEEHTSELQSLMRSSYAVFCLTKEKTNSHSIVITDISTTDASRPEIN